MTDLDPRKYIKIKSTITQDELDKVIANYKWLDKPKGTRVDSDDYYNALFNTIECSIRVLQAQIDELKSNQPKVDEAPKASKSTEETILYWIEQQDDLGPLSKFLLKSSVGTRVKMYYSTVMEAVAVGNSMIKTHITQGKQAAWREY